MSKNKITVLVIAGVMLLAGIIFCVVSLFAVPSTGGTDADADRPLPGSTISIEDSIPADALEFELAEVQKLDARLAEDDLTLFPYVGGTTVKVQIDEAARDNYEVYAKDGVLSVIRKNRLGTIFSEDHDVVIWLPAGFLQSGDIKAETASGDIDVNQIFSGGSLTLNSSSGDIELVDSRFASIAVDTASGEVEAEGSTCLGKLTVDTSSGDIVFSGSELNEVVVDTASGSIRGEQSKMSGAVRLDSTSGNVTLTDCELTEVTVETTSGDVALRLPGDATAYGIRANTVSGTVNGTYNMIGEKQIRVETTSGDVTIAFEAEASDMEASETEQGV